MYVEEFRRRAVASIFFFCIALVFSVISLLQPWYGFDKYNALQDPNFEFVTFLTNKESYTYYLDQYEKTLFSDDPRTIAPPIISRRMTSYQDAQLGRVANFFLYSRYLLFAAMGVEFISLILIVVLLNNSAREMLVIGKAAKSYIFGTILVGWIGVSASVASSLLLLGISKNFSSVIDSCNSGPCTGFFDSFYNYSPSEMVSGQAVAGQSWGPLVGWWFGLGAGATAIVAAGLLTCVKVTEEGDLDLPDLAL